MDQTAPASPISTQMPTLAEWTANRFSSLHESFFKNGKLDLNHEAFCPYLAGELLESRAMLDRYPQTPEILAAATPIDPAEWIRVVKAARGDHIPGLGKTSIFECFVPELWCSWLEFRVKDGGWREDNTPHTPKNRKADWRDCEEAEIHAACLIGQELDRVACMIWALERIVELPYQPIAVKQEFRALQASLETRLSDSIDSTNMLGMPLWLDQAKPELNLIVRDIRPEMWHDSTFRKTMRFAAQPVIAPGGPFPEFHW